MIKKINYKVIDNFLSEEEYNNIHNLLHNKYFPWYYFPDITNTNKESKGYLFYLAHTFYAEDSPNSSYFNQIKFLLKKIDTKSLIRIKANLYPNQGNNEPLNEMHIDYPFKHKGAIYSINTCNGGTILKDGTFIKSVKNRLLLFDPSEMHDSKSASDVKARLNININYF